MAGRISEKVGVVTGAGSGSGRDAAARTARDTVDARTRPRAPGGVAAKDRTLNVNVNARGQIRDIAAALALEVFRPHGPVGHPHPGRDLDLRHRGHALQRGLSGMGRPAPRNHVHGETSDVAEGLSHHRLPRAHRTTTERVENDNGVLLVTVDESHRMTRRVVVVDGGLVPQ